MKRMSVLSALALVAFLLSFSSIGHAQPGCLGATATLTGSGTIRGTDGPDVIVGSSGPDVILGRDGDDIICGLGGDDYINGGAGDDRIDGGADNDIIRGGRGSDRIDGGAGDEDSCVSQGRQDFVSNCELPNRQTRRPRMPPPSEGRTFRICAGENSAVEREIEQMIAGRSFSTTVQSRPDGCFDLTIALLSQGPSGGRQNAVVSLGSSNSGQGISVRIVSEAGSTTVSIR